MNKRKLILTLSLTPALLICAHARTPCPNYLCMGMVRIEPGTFTMGTDDPNANWDQKPAHNVTITYPFRISQTEITLGEFRRFDPDFEGSEQLHPYATGVSWHQANEFCKWLTAKDGKTYRLPTEAEWEYACRAGTTTRYHNGNDFLKTVQVGNVLDAAARREFPNWKHAIVADDRFAFTAPVGSFRPNRFGLYDMHGNVWEWCSDWYAADYYKKSPAADPTGPVIGQKHVLRGGCWY